MRTIVRGTLCGPLFVVFLFLFCHCGMGEVAASKTGSRDEVQPAVVFEPKLANRDELKQWAGIDPQFVTLTEGFQSSPAISVEITGSDPSHNLIPSIPLEATCLAGARLKIDAMIRAENVAATEQSYHGIKIGIVAETSGLAAYADENPKDKYYAGLDQPSGSYDWRHVEFNVAVPNDAKKVQFRLGLERTTGRVSFSNIKITRIGSAKRTRPSVPASGPRYQPHELSRLRGTMVSPRSITEADLRILAEEWNVNLIRWPLGVVSSLEFGSDTRNLTPAEYQSQLDAALDRLDQLIPVCRKLGIVVALDLHDLPGGYDRTLHTSVMFLSKVWQDEFPKVWEKIATRYKGEKTIWAYDLANEPDEQNVAAGLMGWNDLAAHTAKVVRAIDPDRPIIIEGSNWDAPRSFDQLKPVPVSNVIYSVHMYVPVGFTHQGVSVLGGHVPFAGYSYPGEFMGLDWNKERLRKVLQPVMDFQKDYNVPIYVGEFSCIRWAPGDSAYNYIKDCIEIFEENGWDWSYHAFREWDGWSVEHGAKREDLQSVPTRRKELLLDWFSKNTRKPAQKP